MKKFRYFRSEPVSFQTSLHFPETNVPINTRRTNCSSLTNPLRGTPGHKLYRKETRFDEHSPREERDKFVNFKYDYRCLEYCLRCVANGNYKSGSCWVIIFTNRGAPFLLPIFYPSSSFVSYNFLIFSWQTFLLSILFLLSENHAVFRAVLELKTGSKRNFARRNIYRILEMGIFIIYVLFRFERSWYLKSFVLMNTMILSYERNSNFIYYNLANTLAI